MAVSTDSAHKGIQERFTAAVNVIRGLPKNGKQTLSFALEFFKFVFALVQSNDKRVPHRHRNKTIYKTNRNSSSADN